MGYISNKGANLATALNINCHNKNIFGEPIRYFTNVKGEVEMRVLEKGLSESSINAWKFVKVVTPEEGLEDLAYWYKKYKVRMSYIKTCAEKHGYDIEQIVSNLQESPYMDW